MELDFTTIISGAVGSLLAMIGSIIVAYIYINNQALLEKNKRINEQIQKTYIEQGILKLEEAIQEYAVASIFVLMDYRSYLVRYYKAMNNESLFLNKVEEIKKRPTVKDLLQRQFSSAIDSFPYVRRFDVIIYGTVIKVFQHWSELISDIMTWENMKNQIHEAGIDEVERSITGILNMIQESQLYLLKRLDNLKDYIWRKDYNNYAEFLNALEKDEYKNFINDLKEYNILYNKIIDAMKSPNSEDRLKMSEEFNKFIKNIKENPFNTT